MAAWELSTGFVQKAVLLFLSWPGQDPWSLILLCLFAGTSADVMSEEYPQHGACEY